MARIQDLISVEKKLSTGKDEMRKKYADKMRKMDEVTSLHLDEINKKVADRGAIIDAEVEKMTKNLKSEGQASPKMDPKKSEKAKTMIMAAFEKLLV